MVLPLDCTFFTYLFKILWSATFILRVVEPYRHHSFTERMGSISRVGGRKTAFQSDQFPTLKFFQNGLALDPKGAILGLKAERGGGGERM